MIPCLDEAASIGALVQGVRRHLPRVLVVDDGSSDATAALARAAGATVEAHPRNLGKGAALRTGLTAAMRLGADRALLMDGDGQHAPDDIPHFLAAAEDDNIDLIVGNRMGNPVALSPVRRWVNRWMSRRISRRVGFPCPDSQCGFRLLRLAAWSVVSLRLDHYEVESEMLIAFVASGRQVRFVPVGCLPSCRPSHIRPLADSWRWFRWWFGSPGGGS
ncbi:MAG: glycosyltransferase family 2 protein [Verrucomicrobiales bacterium]|nr:glycosyltransferase family 2 protein [Verrucomicrobiales bacterium]MCP5526631.1 glycosyltransferase family 2 protein [Verrucomicrobiales bacterium]